MIYFLQAKDGNIKIGFTEDYFTRKYQLDRKHGGVKALGFIEGSRTEEQMLHKQFDACRITPRGEWFRPSADLLEYIKVSTTLELPAARVPQKASIQISDDTAKALYMIMGKLQSQTGKKASFNDAVTHLLECAGRL